MRHPAAMVVVAVLFSGAVAAQAQDTDGEDDEPTCVLTNLEHFEDGIGLKDKYRLWRFNSCINNNCDDDGSGEIGGEYQIVEQDDGTTNLEVTC